MCDPRENVLKEMKPHDHAACLFDNVDSLADDVSAFVDRALHRGWCAIIATTSRVAPEIEDRLLRMGHDCAAMRSSGQLVNLDAAEMLLKFEVNGRLDQDMFNRIMRPTIERSQRQFGGLALYGDIVNLLWHAGDASGAHTLECLWNELVDEYGFSLLCGYQVDVLDYLNSVQRGIGRICSTHTHLVPVGEYERFDQAVRNALNEAFPYGDSKSLSKYLLDRNAYTTHMPQAQAILLALNEILPSVAHEVRLIARDHYRRAAGGQEAKAQRRATEAAMTQ